MDPSSSPSPPASVSLILMIQQNNLYVSRMDGFQLPLLLIFSLFYEWLNIPRFEEKTVMAAGILRKKEREQKKTPLSNWETEWRNDQRLFLYSLSLSMFPSFQLMFFMEFAPFLIIRSLSLSLSSSHSNKHKEEKKKWVQRASDSIHFFPNLKCEEEDLWKDFPSVVSISSPSSISSSPSSESFDDRIPERCLGLLLIQVKSGGKEE